MADTPDATDPASSDRSSGFDVVRANARIEARSAGWRARRASIALAAGLIVAPAVALVPPHAPWALGGARD